MQIREFKEKDREEIVQMMRSEGSTDSMEHINSENTFVLEDEGIAGFINWKMEHSLPSLRHFCFRKDKRNLEYIRLLLSFYKIFIINMGFTKTIVNADKPYLCKMIEYYFKTKPYGECENVNFYLCEVS